MTSTTLPTDIARRQHGVLSRDDLIAAGITRGQRGRLERRGLLEAVTPRVFRVAGAPRTRRQDAMAACLDRSAVASHRTAAWLHGLDGFGPPTGIEVLGLRPKAHASSTIAIVHTTTWLPTQDVVTVDSIPATSVARTLLSLCGLVPRELAMSRARRAIDQAVRDDLASDPWLWWRLERLRRSGRNGVRVLERLLTERGEGVVTESWLESHALRVLADAGLPTPVCQQRIERDGAFVARVDFLYPAARVVIEVSGHRWHRTRAQVQHDAERRRELVLAGFLVLDFTYDDVVRFPERLVAQVAASLHRTAAA